jgi:Tyrosine phosphatase family
MGQVLIPRYVADQEYSAENIEWCNNHRIRICHIRMQSAKEPFIENDPELVAEALSHLLDSRNYPLLIHSNKGKHRWSPSILRMLINSGVVIGCLRKLQGWSFASIFNEYDRYAQGKGEWDLQVCFYGAQELTASSLKILRRKSISIPSISLVGCHKLNLLICNLTLCKQLCSHNLIVSKNV